jgi:predicted aspartyl protease
MKQKPAPRKTTSYSYSRSDSGFYFPTIPVTIRYKNTAFDTKALVDSGATISVFHMDVAEQLGIEIRRGDSINLQGIGGRILGYAHKLEMETAEKRFSCTIIFSEEIDVSLNILGRKGLFENFKILFDEKSKKLTLG